MKKMTFKFVVRLQNWQRTSAFYFDFPECKKTASLDACQVLREHTGVCCSAQEDSWDLVCGCSRFQAVAGDWEKRGEHSQIKHNSQEMSQNTCERSGFVKYKLRVQYFDLPTQKKAGYGEWREEKSGHLRVKGSVILKLFSPRTLWCFKKYFQNWHRKVLVVPLLKHQVEKLFISFL